ncbi:hypothetical protein KJ633_08640 [bacterium]|nr:hypothetical protein [bacterium]MBU4134562.1 hypothetical protein [bacterium]
MEENREVFGEDMDIENLAMALSDSEGSDGRKSDLTDPPAPHDSADGSKSESQLPGASSARPGGPAASEDGDIEALIKKYEEIPTGKKELIKKDKSGPGKAKSLPIAPIAAAAGVIIILALLKFIVFKPVTTVKGIPSGQNVQKTAVSTPGAGAVSEGVDYPGGAVLFGETKEGIETKIFETAATARDIKLFYQKKMTEKGFELSTSRKNRLTFNMNFFKNSAGYSVSVVPHAGKNLIVVTRAE